MSENLTGEGSPQQHFARTSVAKMLVRSVSQKLKKKNYINREKEDDYVRGVSSRCLKLYGKGGGCKVGADTDEDFRELCGRRRSSASDVGNGHTPLCQNKIATANCFSNGLRGKFWKRTNKKALELESADLNRGMDAFLPNDILEMCLLRLPLASLMSARLVCKKWRNLTMTPHFWQMRQEGSFQNPWLFLFGVVKDGCCSAEVHALDVSFNQWHKLDSDILKGRFSFSVLGIYDDVYIVGGCSSLSNFGKVDKSSFKTHKSVLIFSPLLRSWRKAAPMRYARSSPILGVYENNSDCLIVGNQQTQADRRFSLSRVGGVSEVYEDPQRISVRRQFRHADEHDLTFLPNRKPYKFVRQKKEHSTKDQRRFLLVAVGGLGCWDEPLYSGEIYDSTSNKWTEMQRLPVDFGIACSGVVFNATFYVYSETDKLAAYHIEGGYWVGIQITAFPPRVREYRPKLISCNTRLFLLSVSWCEGDGQIGRRNRAVRKLWELDLVHLNLTEVSIHPDAPMDWNAAFVADRNLIFGVEMFKIFGQVLDFSTVGKLSDAGTKWSHMSRNHVAHELDVASCMTKSLAVLHL